jgi:hypothetical protein
MEQVPGDEELMPDDRRLLGRSAAGSLQLRRLWDLVLRHMHDAPLLEVCGGVDGTVVAELEELVRVDLEVEVRFGREGVAGPAEEPDHLPRPDVRVVEDPA